MEKRMLLAVPLVHDRALRAVSPGAAIPTWLRWLSRLSLGTRIDFDAIRQGNSEPLYLAAPAPPTRDVARLTRRTATALLAEARSAARAVGEVTSDAGAVGRIADIADEPPAGTTLAIAGDDDHTRGRYDGVARGLLQELEPLGAIRSWGRFDVAADGSCRITCPCIAPRRHERSSPAGSP